MTFDVVIRGGSVHDGSGAPARDLDVGVRAGRIAAVDRIPEGAGAREVDARGALVCPGFVDVHTHYDLCLGWAGLTAHALRQGITTVVGGNCGLGDADVGAVLERARAARLGLSFGVLAPLGPLRSTVVPRSAGRAASAAELPRVTAAVSAALDQGALGLSWGPYEANSLCSQDELAAAVAAAGARGRPFVVHRRSEGPTGLDATREAISLARAGGAPLQISHLKAAGRANWGHFEPVLELLEQARRGHDVTVDVYPYDASLTYLSAMLPDALKADGGLLARLKTSEGRLQARAGLTKWFAERQGPEHVVVHEPSLPGIARGSSLAAAARALGLDDPLEAMLRLVEADPRGTGGWATYRHTMAPEQVEHALDLPYAAVASDAVPAEDGSGLDASTHPRVFSTFARALDRGRARGPAALARAVRQCTALGAARFGLERGRLTPGAPADVVVLRDLVDEATYETPDRYPRGVEVVLVNGVIAFEGGQVTGDARGEVLRG